MEAERSRLSLEGIGASSPGEALKLILYNQSTHDFLQVKSHHLEYSPQKAHKRLKQIINALQSENPEDQHIQESISDPKYKQLGVEYETDLNHFYNFCVFVLIKNRNNQRITKRWNAFTGEVLETAKLIKKLTHPSQKRTGFVQENERRHKNP